MSVDLNWLAALQTIFLPEGAVNVAQMLLEVTEVVKPCPATVTSLALRCRKLRRRGMPGSIEAVDFGFDGRCSARICCWGLRPVVNLTGLTTACITHKASLIPGAASVGLAYQDLAQHMHADCCSRVSFEDPSFCTKCRAVVKSISCCCGWHSQPSKQ